MTHHHVTSLIALLLSGCESGPQPAAPTLSSPAHLAVYPWRIGVEYEYRVERGARVTLPPG